jgi:hypothetical protein
MTGELEGAARPTSLAVNHWANASTPRRRPRHGRVQLRWEAPATPFGSMDRLWGGGGTASPSG